MNTKTFIWSFCALGAAIAISTSADALPVSIESYDMVNGNSGKFNYFDHTYSGTSTPLQPGDEFFGEFVHPEENATLTGGTGILTDGIIATDLFDVDSTFTVPHGNYVGWTREYVDSATITFNLAPGSTTEAVTIWVDDPDGVGSANHPYAAIINGTEFLFSDPTPAVDMPQPGICDELGPCAAVDAFLTNSTPFSNTFVGNWETDTLVLELIFLSKWMLVSEIILEYTPVENDPTPIDNNPTPPPPSISIPEPGTLAIFGIGLLGLGVARRRKSA